MEDIMKLYLRRDPMAAAISITPRYLSMLTARGAVPCVRLGKRCVLYRVSDVERALNKFRHNAVAEIRL